jgi:hypothetical protein
LFFLVLLLFLFPSLFCTFHSTLHIIFSYLLSTFLSFLTVSPVSTCVPFFRTGATLVTVFPYITKYYSRSVMFKVLALLMWMLSVLPSITARGSRGRAVWRADVIWGANPQQPSSRIQAQLTLCMRKHLILLPQQVSN